MRQLILLAFLLVFCFPALPQSNSVKGFVFGLGESVKTIGIWNAALSYEHYFGKHHSVVINASYLMVDAPGFPLDGTFFSVRYGGSISYRYYFVSEKRFVNKLWISPGLRYQNWFYESHNQTSVKKQSDFYGINLLIGKQIWFSGEKRNWAIDLGFGGAYGKRGYSLYESKYRDHETGEQVVRTGLPPPYFLFLPELMIRLGIRF